MTCSICQETNSSLFMTTTKCNHNFHKQCLDNYLIHQNKMKKDTRCPLCRTSLHVYFDEECIQLITVTNKGISYTFNGKPRFLPLPFPK